MIEIELKLQVPRERRDAVAREVAGPAPARRTRLQAAYVDTADEALARAGLALRVRREGRRWVQTLKGAAEDGMTRAEHNVPREGGAGVTPSADASLHAETDVGRRLLSLIADKPLEVRYGTDIWRRHRVVRGRQASIELAFDEGAVIAGNRRWPICELEIESVSGSPAAVIDAARRWVLRHGLWLDTRTKAERGGLLSRGQAMAPPTRAAAIGWHRHLPPSQGEAAMLNGCLRHVAANASQIASGEYEDEHVHQLRVGLRRLRSGLRLFGDDSSLSDAAAQWFRELGRSRDAAMLRPFEAELEAVLAGLGLALAPPEAPKSGEPIGDPASTCRAPVAQGLLLDVMARVAALSGTTVESSDTLHDLLAGQLSRWHRRVVADARRFDELDDAARHQMRKRVKRLRYVVEFSAGLFEGKAQRHYAKRLRRLQARLGELNDAHTALLQWRERAAELPGNAFAVGWLAARRQSLIDACRPAAAAFIDTSRFWK